MVNQGQELGHGGTEKPVIPLQSQLDLGENVQPFIVQVTLGAVLIRFHGQDDSLVLHLNLGRAPVHIRLPEGAPKPLFPLVIQQFTDDGAGNQHRMPPSSLKYRADHLGIGIHHPLYGFRKEHGELGRQDEYPVA